MATKYQVRLFQTPDGPAEVTAQWLRGAYIVCSAPDAFWFNWCRLAQTGDIQTRNCGPATYGHTEMSFAPGRGEVLRTYEA